MSLFKPDGAPLHNSIELDADDIERIESVEELSPIISKLRHLQHELGTKDGLYGNEEEEECAMRRFKKKKAKRVHDAEMEAAVRKATREAKKEEQRTDHQIGKARGQLYAKYGHSPDDWFHVCEAFNEYIKKQIQSGGV